MTDLVVDRKLLCTEYFRVDERVARHAVFPSLSRCQPWRPDEWDQVYEAPDPYSRPDSCTSDELVVLHNGPSERLGTIEVSIWRGVFRSHSNVCTARKTVRARRYSRSGTDLQAAQSTWFNGSMYVTETSRPLPSPASCCHILYRLTGQRPLIGLEVGVKER